MNRKERERELEAMLGSPGGAEQIISLWRGKVLEPGQMGQPGMLATQMIPLILDAEFPVVEIIKATGPGTAIEVAKVAFTKLRLGGHHDADCTPDGVVSKEQIQVIGNEICQRKVCGNVGEFEWRA